MRWNDIVDDDRVVGGDAATEGNELFLRSVLRIDVESDAVEVTIDAWRIVATGDAAGALHGACVNALDTDGGKGAPKLCISERRENRLPLGRDERRWVGGKPYGGD